MKMHFIKVLFIGSCMSSLSILHSADDRSDALVKRFAYLSESKKELVYNLLTTQDKQAVINWLERIYPEADAYIGLSKLKNGTNPLIAKTTIDADEIKAVAQELCELSQAKSVSVQESPVLVSDKPDSDEPESLTVKTKKPKKNDVELKKDVKLKKSPTYISQRRFLRSSGLLLDDSRAKSVEDGYSYHCPKCSMHITGKSVYQDHLTTHSQKNLCSS